MIQGMDDAGTGGDREGEVVGVALVKRDVGAL